MISSLEILKMIIYFSTTSFRTFPRILCCSSLTSKLVYFEIILKSWELISVRVQLDLIPGETKLQATAKDIL